MSAKLPLLFSQVPKPDTPTHLKKYCADLIDDQQNPAKYLSPAVKAKLPGLASTFATAAAFLGDNLVVVHHFHNWWLLPILIPASVIFPAIVVRSIRDIDRYDEAALHLENLPPAVAHDFLPPSNEIISNLAVLEPDTVAKTSEELTALLHHATELYHHTKKTKAGLVPLTPTTLLSSSRRAEYLAKKRTYAAASNSYNDLLTSVKQTAAASTNALAQLETAKAVAPLPVDLTSLQQRLNTHANVYNQLNPALAEVLLPSRSDS